MLGLFFSIWRRREPSKAGSAAGLLKMLQEADGMLALDTLTDADYALAKELERQGKAKIVGGTWGDSEYLVIPP